MIPTTSVYAPIRATVKLFEALPDRCKIRPMHKHAKPKVAITDKIRSIKDAGGCFGFLEYSISDILVRPLSFSVRVFGLRDRI
jgi:hypothetical protein